MHHAPVTVLVEGFAPDAIALARVLAGEGRAVRLAGPGHAPPEALALRDLGVAVEPAVDLDADPGTPAVAFLDVWTPEVAPRVQRLCAAGTRLSCLAELLLERSPVRTLGITGTAGKTTTATFAVQLLRAAGVEVAAGTTARAANLWATEEHLAALPGLRPPAVLALELTSSHLCLLRSSPDVAVVTSFWPDHVELHGSLAAYRRAKEAIVRHQHPEAWVVVNDDDPEARAFRELTPAHRASFSVRGPVERGAYLAGDRVVVRWQGEEATLAGAAELPLAGALRANVVAALAAALAAGAPLESLAAGLGSLEPPPHRGSVVARSAEGIAVSDAGLAATPAKAVAVLAAHRARSVVLVAGGELSAGAGGVHASAEERALLLRSCDEVAGLAAAAVLFGPAADEIGGLLEQRGLPVRRAAALEDALEQAMEAAAPGQTVLFAPMFPVEQEERARVPLLARQAAGRVRE